jgi:prepilin-type N-terminal cleavage/methylation domain-containing protein
MISTEKRHSKPSESGFTLLEMIIAVTLVAMMALTLWAVFRISIRSWSRGTAFIDTNQHHRSITDLVRKQLASTFGIFAPGDPEKGYAPTLVFSGAEDSIRFISINSLHFQESPGLTLVQYEVDRDSNGDFSLIEKESRYLGQLPDPEIFVGQSKPTTIFSNLTSCIFEYFDPGSREIPSQWVRDWDGRSLRRLPAAISITMSSRDAKGTELRRYMVVPVKAEARDFRLNAINPFGTGVRGVLTQ